MYSEILNRKDPLTGFHTKEGLYEYLSSRIFSVYEKINKLSVVILDLDKFKKINDSYGHLIGDEALKFFSATINKVLKGSYFVARYGGDEFVIVMPDSSDKKESCRVALQIKEALKIERLSTIVGRLRLRTSIGVATYPDDSKTPKDLLQMADQALYYAKRHGRNHIIRYQSLKKFGFKDRVLSLLKLTVLALIILSVVLTYRQTDSLRGAVVYYKNIFYFLEHQWGRIKDKSSYAVFQSSDGKTIEGWLVTEDSQNFYLSAVRPFFNLNPSESNALLRIIKIPKGGIFSSTKILR